jgi:endo-1,4-beta-xylanase
VRTNLLQTSVVSVAFGIVSCGAGAQPTGDSGPEGASGSSTSVAGGNNVTAGAGAAGFTSAGGAGNSTGGVNTNGGSGFGNAGNPATGGASSGGGGRSGAGGASMGGASTGGAASGGGGRSGAGGASTGGASMGGAGNGGAANGGAASGGAAGSAGAGACPTSTAHSGGTQHCSNSTGNVSGGYSFESWSSGTGTGCMTPYGGGDAAFKANWSNVGDYLARVGLGWNSTQTYDQLGTIAADYSYTKTGSGGGFSFIGIYGWSEGTLIEYYIVDDWFGGGSPPTGGGTMKGSFTVDGGKYNVYQHQQNNQPAITGGNTTFQQYFSVRQTPRQCGHISITEHFKEWASLNMPLGKMEEARLLVEVGGGTGTIDYGYATLTATQ